LPARFALWWTISIYLYVDCIWKNEQICASILAAADIQWENLGKFWGPALAKHWKLNNSHCMLGLYLHNIFSKL